jgi:hypothetical protein
VLYSFVFDAYSLLALRSIAGNLPVSTAILLCEGSKPASSNYGVTELPGPGERQGHQRHGLWFMLRRRTAGSRGRLRAMSSVLFVVPAAHGPVVGGSAGGGRSRFVVTPLQGSNDGVLPFPRGFTPGWYVARFQR